MKSFFKALFKRKELVDNKVVIIVEPVRRDIDYIKLMPTTETAQALYDFVYNEYVFYMTKYDAEKAETYRELMIKFKQIAEKNGHKLRT